LIEEREELTFSNENRMSDLSAMEKRIGPRNGERVFRSGSG
jgi:hypothetical protein